MSGKKREAEAVSFDPDDILREQQEFEERMAERREGAIATLLEQRREIDAKLAKLGHNVAPSGSQRSTRASAPKAEGERRQRTCPKCGVQGHGWKTCQNEAQASWANDPRSQQ